MLEMLGGKLVQLAAVRVCQYLASTRAIINHSPEEMESLYLFLRIARYLYIPRPGFVRL